MSRQAVSGQVGAAGRQVGGGIEGQKTGAPAAQLKVQMGATGRARHAHRPQYLPLVEPLALRHAGAEQVGVEGLPALTMVEQHGVP